MKIIALTDPDNRWPSYLVEMTDRELSAVAQEKSSLRIGAKIEVNEAWNDLQKFRAAQSQIEKAAETLKACAQLSITAGAVYVIPPPDETPPNAPAN